MSPSIPESTNSAAYFGLRKVSTLKPLFESWPILFPQNILPWAGGAWVRCLVMIMSPDSGLWWSQGTCHDQSSGESSVQVTWSALTNHQTAERLSVITIREGTGANISFPRNSIIWHLSWLWILKIFIKSNHNITTTGRLQRSGLQQWKFVQENV